MEEVLETTETNETVETQETVTEQVEQTEHTDPETTEQTEKTFTQKELDEIIQKRLERERETVSKKAAQEARDAWVAEQGWVDYEGKPITTDERYREVLLEKELREKYSELPEDAQRELIESKKFREKYEAERAESEKRAKQQEDFQLFLKTFPDTKPEDIPQTVWDEVDKGRSLVDAFTRHENQQLKEQLAKLTEQKKIEEQNQANLQSSTGSVTGQGASQTYFTPDQVKNMSRDEVNKHWDAIMESQKKWK